MLELGPGRQRHLIATCDHGTAPGCESRRRKCQNRGFSVLKMLYLAYLNSPGVYKLQLSGVPLTRPYNWIALPLTCQKSIFLAAPPVAKDQIKQGLPGTYK